MTKDTRTNVFGSKEGKKEVRYAQPAGRQLLRCCELIFLKVYT